MKGHTLKASFAKLLVAFMVVLSIAIITPAVADAATTPALNKTTRTILAGKQYDLNIKNKIAKSTYTWTTSDKKIATVDKKGVVTGVNKGTATITCEVKAPKKTYTLTCTVSIIKPAKLIQIKNKVTALNVGQSYNLDRTLVPSTSNDKTSWTTSDATIAAPDKNGKFTALKEGTVTLTATTLSGAKDTVTIKVVDAAGTVANQSDLNALLGSGASSITLKTTDAVAFEIAAGDYSNQSLVVDAPNADVTNEGVFKSIEIKDIKSSTWNERAKGNTIKIADSDARIVIGSGASVSIEATTEGAKLVIVNNGVVKELEIPKNASIEITGTSTEPIPVNVNVTGVKLTSSVPLKLECEAKIDLTLLKGAEATTITAATEAAIPSITGNVKIDVIVGSGDTATTKPVTGTPIVEVGGGSSGGGSVTPSTPSTKLTFDGTIEKVSAISVTTASNKTYSLDGIELALIKGLLMSSNATADWTNLPNQSYTTGGQKVTISGAGSSQRTVSIESTYGNRTYTVTVGSNLTGTYATVVNSSNISVTVTKSIDEKSFSLTTAYSIQSATDKVKDIENSQALADATNKIKSVSITYNTKTYTVDCPELVTIKKYIDAYITYDVTTAALVWSGYTGTKTIDGDTFTITGTGATKNLTFTAGQFAGRSYTIALNGTTVVVTNSSSFTAVINKTTDVITVALN